MPTPAAAPTLDAIAPDVLRTAREGTAPFAGEVVMHRGQPVLAVPSGDVTGTGLWSADGEHVLQPLDVALTDAGVRVLLPLCAQELGDLARRRDAADAPFDPGEVVTLAVSVLRGTVAEASQHPGDECAGRWWLDEAGRPLFVHTGSGDGAVAAGVSAIRMLRASADQPRLVAALDDAIVCLGDDERRASAAAGVEDALFGVAAPCAVATEVLSRRAATVSLDAAESAAPPEPRLWERLVGAWDAPIAGLVASTASALRPRRRPRGERRSAGGSRRGMLLLAAGCAALVMAIGLLWPADEEPDAAQTGVPTAPASGVDAPTAGADAAGQAVASPDLATRATELLGAWRSCADDACRYALQEAPAALATTGAAMSPSPTVTLLDDFGGLATLRVEDPTGAAGAQIVSIVRQNEKWVLRGINDVAQHP
ncbi:hypothetical protein AB0N73_00805 [Microbacterium sp. NPDC089189]|uniref:hypothetical protein n=1 Tax=Microbacterium sp. NPDC089189 TaxID=3154972 RepID=UPI003437733F